MLRRAAHTMNLNQHMQQNNHWSEVKTMVASGSGGCGVCRYSQRQAGIPAVGQP